MLFIIILSGMVATSALACPIWMGLMSRGDMPCSNQPTPEKCPHSICLASSPYLAADGSAHVPLLRELGTVVVVSNPILTSLQGFELTANDDASPPGPKGPLFLRTHSLLI